MALGVPEGKIDVVYPAEDWENQPELESRSETASSPGPVVFLGGLGFDQRKGFDLLIEAWEMLVRDGDWDLSLIVAGGGPAVNHWRERLARNSWADRIELRGFQRDPRALLQSAEILVSPVRYEPYGLNVYEALCLGRPAIVTESAGVAEHYQGKWKELLLPAPPRAEEVAQRLRHWRAQRDFWRKEAELRAPFFRQRDSRMMADEIIAMVQKTFGENTPPNQPDDGKNRDLSGSRIESIRDAG
jgi:glycosyltransferase involved in cell wall biosynthesis